jgi:hypothetical protein
MIKKTYGFLKLTDVINARVEIRKNEIIEKSFQLTDFIIVQVKPVLIQRCQTTLTKSRVS